MTEATYQSRVVALRPIGPSAYELTFERCGMQFEAGQCLTIHDTIPQYDRTYTIASGEADEHLQIVFKLIPHGKLTPKLAGLKPGDAIRFSGPFGEFTVRDRNAPLIFIATGTGIAPCLSYLRTEPGLDVTLIHGVRKAADLYYRDLFQGRTYYPCVSREAAAGAFEGRVTAFWPARSWPEHAHYHLCGSNEMIFDMQVLLQRRGVPEDRIHTEAYYYRLYS